MINVANLDETVKQVAVHGGHLVVEPFTISGVGSGCYITDLTGLLVGFHENNPEA